MKTNKFSKEVAFLKSKMPGFKGIISPSFLRAEVELTDATGNFEFDFRNAKGVKQLTEQLLKENDLFRVMEVHFAIASRLIALPSIRVPQQYPNQVVFDSEANDSPAGTFDATHLEALFNGNLSYKKGDTIYLSALALNGSRFVPQTQQSALTNASSTEQEGSGIIALERPFSLSGSDTGNLNLNIPAASGLKIQYSTTANAGKKVIAILQLNGILVSGGSKIMTASANEMM